MVVGKASMSQTLDNKPHLIAVHACLRNYSKTGLRRSLKNRQTKVLKTNVNLLMVESIAECSPCSMTCIKRYSVLKTIFVFFLNVLYTCGIVTF